MLAGGRIRAHDAFVAVDDLLREALREHELALVPARILIAQLRGDRTARRRVSAHGVVAHGQHDVVVEAGLLGVDLVQDDAGDVFLVQALHDDDDGGLDGRVEARRDRLQKPLPRRVTLLLRGRALDAVWVVDDDAVAARAGD